MIRRIVKWLVFKCIYPLCYRLAAGKQVKSQKIVMVENHKDFLPDDFTILYRQLQAEGYTVVVHYLQVASSAWKDIICRSLGLIWDMGDAACIFINESNSLFGAFSLREETQLVQLWHACGAFKKWGFSVADKTFGEDAKALEQYSGHGNYTLVPVSGRAVCWAYEEAFGLQGRDVVKPLGVSRTDLFFDKGYCEAARQSVREAIPFLQNRKIILYAPTFRGEIRQARTPDALDLNTFYDSFSKEYVLIIKNHPFVKEQMVIPKQYEDFCMEAGDSFTVNALMLAADICITDYSSVVFEYALLHKPIYFFAFDLKEYYDERGFYYPYEEFVPGPVLRSNEELAEAVSKADAFDYTRLEHFCQTYMDGCDGHATERILQIIRRL